jgi:HlyD family secretion protein
MHTEIDVENPQGTLKEGMYAEVKLVLQEEENALTVPIEAVQRNGSGARILVVDSAGQIQDRKVTVGTESSDRVQVLSGLNENDRVVIGNRGRFHPGDKVKPIVVSANPDSQEDH